MSIYPDIYYPATVGLVTISLCSTRFDNYNINDKFPVVSMNGYSTYLTIYLSFPS